MKLFLPHNLFHGVSFLCLAAAPDLAIFFNLLDDSFFARAGPPFRPPSLPKATAAGFFSGLSAGCVSLALPVANATMRAAHWFKSRGRFGGFVMGPLKGRPMARQAI